MRTVITGVTLAAIGLAVWQSLMPSVAPPRKKLIYYGWGSRDTMYVREHWQEMEKMPFDGIGISVAIDRNKPTTGDGATGNLLGWNIFGPKAFRLEDFRPAIDDLRVAKWRKFTDNFLACAIATQAQDQGLTWFDDARWKIITNNWRILVTIAKESGCKGILLDLEHYDYPCELFCYRHHRAQRVNKPFGDYLQKARQRGRELMESTRQIFPDITILCLFVYRVVLSELQQGKRLEEARYALLPAFLDGMLEGSDKRMKLVDGGAVDYGAKDRVQFLEGYHSILNKCLLLTALPQKYREQVQVGFAICLDSAGRWDTSDFNKNYYRPEEFQKTLQEALELTDEYVWMYSEMAGFFPPSNLPDAYLQAIRAARRAVGLPE